MISSFYPKMVLEVHRRGTGNELLCKYLGMDVDEATLFLYAKQGYFTPKSPYDLRVTLQTVLDMLKLLTCKRSVVTPGLVCYVLQQPAR
jgi:hypothetical protein